MFIPYLHVPMVSKRFPLQNVYTFLHVCVLTTRVKSPLSAYNEQI